MISHWQMILKREEKGDTNRSLSINDALNTSTIGQVFTRGKFDTGNINHNILAGIDMGKSSM